MSIFPKYLNLTKLTTPVVHFNHDHQAVNEHQLDIMSSHDTLLALSFLEHLFQKKSNGFLISLWVQSSHAIFQ